MPLRNYRMRKNIRGFFFYQYTAAVLPSLQVAWVNLTSMCTRNQQRLIAENPAPPGAKHINNQKRNT